MRRKVLVVDDEPDILEVLKDRLEGYGFIVVTAKTGREALQRFSAESFDGIFMDIKMPEMNGMEALQEIRKTNRSIPIIVITASSTKETAIAALTQGANDYVLKPFEWDELRAKIERIYGIALPPS